MTLDTDDVQEHTTPHGTDTKGADPAPRLDRRALGEALERGTVEIVDPPSPATAEMATAAVEEAVVDADPEPVTQWKLSFPGMNKTPIVARSDNFGYAGGVAVVVLDDDEFSWDILSLGHGRIALRTTLEGPHGAKTNLFWNTHYGMTEGSRDGGMMLYSGLSPVYWSNGIGPEQTFVIQHNAGNKIYLQPTSGWAKGLYLGAQWGGWYPHEWNLGSGSLLASKDAVSIAVDGDQLIILELTRSGYLLDLQGRDLQGINLANIRMAASNLRSANLSGVTSIDGTDFGGASLQGANLDGLDLGKAKSWRSAGFNGTDLRKVASAARGSFPSAFFPKCRLDGISFVDADLSRADLQNAVVSGAQLDRANLEDARLDGATVGNASLVDAKLAGTVFDGCDLSEAKFGDAPQFGRTTQQRTSFQKVTVPFASLGSNWSYLDLTMATITGIPKKVKINADQALLPDGLDLRGVDLQGSSFRGTRMFHVQLQGANLEKVDLRRAQLKGGQLTGANLRDANLKEAWLIAEQHTQPGHNRQEAAVLANAFLLNTVLDGAHCDGVDFSGAYFLTTDDAESGASAVGAAFNYAKFNNAWLMRTVFDGSQMSAANLSNAVLVGASFTDNGAVATQLTPSTDVTHTQASVYKADLRGADFKGANMDGLNMDHAVVSTSSGDFFKSFKDFDGKDVILAFPFKATVLGDTTSQTLCPNGQNGPCHLS